MADVLGVIQDVLNQDKQQKKEHAKMMREVQKKLKEKEVSEEDGEGDGEEYEKFVKATLKRFKVKSPSELKGDAKKKFYDALDAGWEGDDEKPEPEDEETDLGDRVKARMKAEEDDEKEDEDEAPVGDQDEPDTEPEDEPDPEDVEGEKLDKLADLVIQKLKDKQSEEEDEEEEPEATEAEGGKKEKIDTKPKVESLNPHRKSIWEEALKQVKMNEIRWDLKDKGPEPIPVVIKSVGKQLKDYAKKSGGIDKDDFLTTADVLLQGKLPRVKQIPSDTDPREFVYDLMAKTFGWKFVEQKYGITFNNRRDYTETVEVENMTKEIKQLEERKGYSNLIPFPQKVLTDFAKRAKKAGLDWDQYKKFVKQTFKDGADERSAYIFGRDVYYPTGKQPNIEAVEVDEGLKPGQKVNFDDVVVKEPSRDGKSTYVVVPRDTKGMRGKQDEYSMYQLDKSGKVLDDLGSHPSLAGAKKYVKAKATNREVDEAHKKSKKFKAQCQECGKKFSTASMIPSCPKCHGSDIDLAEETLNEYSDTAWVDKEARKVEHKWKRSSKSQKDKWRKRMAAKAEDEELSQAELDDVLDDYGMTKKFDESVDVKDKLENWGIDIHKEGYMIMPGIDREKYTEIRGMEGPFMTRSGKVLYYDPKAGEYYDRDSDLYLDYSAYLEYDKESPAQKAAMAKSVFDDPKSREYKKMMRDKKKAEKAAQKAARKYSYESVGMSFARKHYQKDKD